MTRWRSRYLIAANTALLIMVVQLGTHALVASYQAMSRRVENRRTDQDLQTVCAGLRFRYGGGAGFLHDAKTSVLVNIDDYGVRSNGGPTHAIAALDNTTWLFGGSTAFGCGVADGDTIAAQLERLTGEAVFNLGVRGYNSAMENRLFNHYLLAGYRPRRVLFINGDEESCASGLFEFQMTDIAVAMQQDYSWGFGDPLRSAVGVLHHWWNRPITGEKVLSRPASIACDDEGRPQALAMIVARRLAERAGLCRLYGVECHTFVNPEGGSDVIEHLAPAWRDAGATFLTGANHIALGINQHLGPDTAAVMP